MKTALQPSITPSSRQSSFRPLIIFSLPLLIFSLLLLTLAYSLRSGFTLPLGEIGSSLYLSGFNSDEAGAPRYRWTGGLRLPPNEPLTATVKIPLALNPSQPAELSLTLRTTAERTTTTAKVTVNGQYAGEVAVPTGEFGTVRLKFQPQNGNFAETVVEITTTGFRPPGDSRTLGLQIANISLQTTPGFRLPPLGALFWLVVLVTAIFGALVRVAHPGLAAGITGLVVLAVVLSPLVAPGFLVWWYTPLLLPILAAIAGLVAIIAWFEAITQGIAWFFAALESSTVLARNLLIIILAIYTLFGLLVVLNTDFIGHADYADNAVAARNIVQGKGYSLDYAAQFYQKYSLPRPADTWPPLQPLLITPFFAVLGTAVWVAKLPNLLLLPVFVMVVFYYGKKWFNRRTAFFGALLLLVIQASAFTPAPAFFETLIYPINDLAFSLLVFLVLASFYELGEGLPTTQRPGWRGYQAPLLAGLWAGLLFLSKPSGAVILLVGAIWLLGRKYLGGRNLPWKALLVAGGTAVLVVSPFIIRNLVTFGALYKSTEQYDAWVTKWNPPDERIYDLFSPFTERGLPNARQLLEFGWDTNFNSVANQFRRFWGHLAEGQLFPLLLAALAVLALTKLPNLSRLLGLNFVIYTLIFCVLWHYEPRYYLLWLPWLALFGLYGLWWICDRIKPATQVDINLPTDAATEPPKNRPTWAATWLAVGGIALLMLPGTLALLEAAPAYQTPTGIVVTANWLKANTPPEAVVMTRNPWELSFHSERRSVMVPNNASLPQIKQVMREYGVTHLQLDHLDDRGINQQWGQRRAVWTLLDKKPDASPETSGFKLIYDQAGLLVYQWNGT